MALRLFDTMTRRLQPVQPLEPANLRVYTCGPTVYARVHIGNFRTFIFEDVLRRVLEQRFPRVTHVMNLTDVEDKIIRNAIAHHVDLDVETAPWIDAFFEDLDTLGLRRAHDYPRATEYIEQMVDLIEKLEEQGVTYRSDGSIYFRIAAFPKYGRLSGVRADALVAGASGRVDADEYDKESPRDFALWKAVGADEPGWDTRLGRGRPGWHIECSAMSMSLLGEHFDIHAGGVDNIFPHHENEIAQSEAATGHEFVRLWTHSEHLRISGEKMAKSLGNFHTVRDLVEQGAKPSAIRYLLAASTHYRKVLNYGDEALYTASQAVERIVAFRDRLVELQPAASNGATADQSVGIAGRATEDFDAALDDDLNLPEGMGVFFTAVREANRLLDEGSVTEEGGQRLLAMVEHVDDVLGVLPLVAREQESQLAPDEQELLDARAAARSARDWARSDALRDELAARGIAVEDTPQGQRWRRG
ncbi:MAG TPA: cysteine--tRNA ligase [Candidatus Angelobacter sp.]|jgi:cysteinyl-tRNA synthetase|nr:cysteine--tRNA ligase [Candidatus Angelobacter sp.]